jgi:hypothetical protein
MFVLSWLTPDLWFHLLHGSNGAGLEVALVRCSALGNLGTCRADSGTAAFHARSLSYLRDDDQRRTRGERSTLVSAFSAVSAFDVVTLGWHRGCS